MHIAFQTPSHSHFQINHLITLNIPKTRRIIRLQLRSLYIFAVNPKKFSLRSHLNTTRQQTSRQPCGHHTYRPHSQHRRVRQLLPHQVYLTRAQCLIGMCRLRRFEELHRLQCDWVRPLSVGVRIVSLRVPDMCMFANLCFAWCCRTWGSLLQRLQRF